LYVVRQLAELCDRPDLGALRVGAYEQDDLRYWNYGRINTGLAHGVGGVVAALRIARECDPTARVAVDRPLRLACEWLANEAYVDARGVTTWAPAGREGRSSAPGFDRRQAWCYGTPGLAWTLWDAGRVLADDALCQMADCSMCSFCSNFDENLYIDDGPPEESLAICHGAAGTLAIANAFALHAGNRAARNLAQRLEAYLLSRASDVVGLARENTTLLTGASGVVLALLVNRGAPRDWLRHIALR
jgi:hypothetical protein